MNFGFWVGWEGKKTSALVLFWFMGSICTLRGWFFKRYKGKVALSKQDPTSHRSRKWFTTRIGEGPSRIIPLQKLLGSAFTWKGMNVAFVHKE